MLLYIVRPLLAGNVYKFSFAVTNPAAGQASPHVSIEVNGYNSRVARVSMQKAGGDSDPLVVAGFGVATIGQSTPSQATINRLSVTLVPYTYLAKGILITISGLYGASEESGSVTLMPLAGAGVTCGIHPLNLTGCQLYFEAPVFSGTVAQGLWSDDEKSLLLRVAAPIVGGTVLTFAWDLHNSNHGQDAQDIRLSGEGENTTENNITLNVQQLQHDTGNNAPLLIAVCVAQSSHRRGEGVGREG